MTEADKAAFAARLRAAEADAAKRGLRLTGYHLEGDRLTFISEPAKRRRPFLRAAMEDAQPEVERVVRRAIRRGVAQGSLL